MAILDNIQVLLKYKPDTDRQYLFRQRQLADVFSVTKKNDVHEKYHIKYLKQNVISMMFCMIWDTN